MVPRYNILFAIVVVLLLGTMGWLLVASDPHPERNTDYAPRYSDKAFQLVTLGMSKGQVIDLLGAPLFMDDFGNQCFVYSRMSEARPFLAKIIDLFPAWVSIRICFDHNGKVLGAYKWIFYD